MQEGRHASLYHDTRAISLVEAIARQEGFGRPGVRATRNHNPGNLNYGLFARTHGAINEDDKGYAVFTSNLDGYAALKALLMSKSYKGLTFRQALLKYAPPKGDPRGDNDTATYISNVCAWCKVTADDVIDAHVDPNTIRA
jgi:hypothetical protein